MSRQVPFRGAKSAQINETLIKRYIEPVAKGEMVPSVRELAQELGVTEMMVSKRISKLRRGQAKVTPDCPCDCDEHGPCLQHFKWRVA